MHTSVTVRFAARNRSCARSMRRRVRYRIGVSPYVASKHGRNGTSTPRRPARQLEIQCQPVVTVDMVARAAQMREQIHRNSARGPRSHAFEGCTYARILAISAVESTVVSTVRRGSVQGSRRGARCRPRPRAPPRWPRSRSAARGEHPVRFNREDRICDYRCRGRGRRPTISSTSPAAPRSSATTRCGRSSACCPMWTAGGVRCTAASRIRSSTLAYAAALTNRIRLGVAVVNLPFVTPTLLAKQTATLDILSGGRLDVGLGLGWADEEYAASGATKHRRRSGAPRSSSPHCKTLWTDDVVRA